MAHTFSSASCLAKLTLVLGIALTAVGAKYVHDTVHEENRKYFQQRVGDARVALDKHLRIYLEALRGLQGLFQLDSYSVTREDFRHYVEHLDLAGRYPGIHAVAFARYLRADQLPAYEAAMRTHVAVKRPDFVVTTGPGYRDHFVADYIKRANEINVIPVGSDLGVEPRRRESLERARDTGQPTVSGLIKIDMRDDGPAGFYLAVPVYRPGAPLGTVEQRRAAFVGCVIAVLRSEDMMRGLFGAPLLQELDIEIYDTMAVDGRDAYDETHLIFDSAAEVAGRRMALHAALPTSGDRNVSNLAVANREWTVVYTGLPSLNDRADHEYQVWLVGAGGLALSVLLFAFIRSISNANQQLEAEVAARTAALNASNAELTESFAKMAAANDALQKAQDQLLQSEKMVALGQLAAGVAHEINNPVGFVKSNLCSLQGHVDGILAVLATYGRFEPALAGHPEALASVTAVKEAADLEFLKQDIGDLIAESTDGVRRVQMIVDDLKNFSRVDTADWHFANLESGLDSTLNIVRNEIKYKADLVKDYGNVPEIECIGSQLNQVFMNVLVNAAHAIETRGTITIRTRADDTSVWIEIADTGMGIPAEIRKRIFEPFFTTKPVGKGTGLGLSLAYSIVQRHQGTLDVESEVGRGTCFRITLPLVRQQAAMDA